MRIAGWILCLAVALASFAAAASEKSGEEKAPAPPQEREKKGEKEGDDAREQELSIYVPPARGTPRTRTGGGTRAPGDWPELVALVPDHVALTAEAQPWLGWHLDGPAAAPLEFALLRDDREEPVVEEVIAERAEAGFGGVSLARFGVELEPGVVYQWFVAVVPDPEQRDRDLLAGGAIERVAAPASLADDVADAEDPYRALARRGLWYDALGSLTREIDAGRDDLRGERAALLAEVGIDLDGGRR